MSIPKFESKRIPEDKRIAWMALARDRYRYALDLDREDRDLSVDDVTFAAALPVKGSGTSQWEEVIARQRIAAKRPVLTENRLPTFTAQVVNDGRQSKPAIKIAAMDGGTKKTAEYFQGRIRQIEYDCQADVAYDTSREQQVTCGRGFLRVAWRYIPGTFKKEAWIKPIPNQFSVVFGPAKEYDCSDAEYCFVISLITKEEHERKYGKETTAQHTNFSSPENPAPTWFGVGTNHELIQEAEYWLKEYKLRTLCHLSNGEDKWEDELPENLEQLGITVEETRQEQDCEVVQYVIDGADILDETEIFGPFIGIVPVWGREWFLDGKRRSSSLIRYAKDPQRLLNLYVSNIAEQIAQMPKSPWWIPVGGVPAGMQAAMENLNNEPRSYAQYNQWDAVTGRPLNPPTRIVNEPPIQALVAGYNQAVDAIKAAMGIFDASLGQKSNETSGIAIDSRKRESDNANFHFHDNEARSRNHIGRILLILIPELDKGKGMRAVRSEDGKTKMVGVGQPWTDPESGEEVDHQLDKGAYGVAVDTGPSFLSQRKEAAAAYSEIAKADPNFMLIAGDKYMRTLDMPGSDEIADRYEKMLPPPLQKQKPGAGQVDPQVQQKFQAIQQQASQVMEGLTAEVQRLQGEIDSQMVQVKSRERIAEMQEQTKRSIAFAELNQAGGLKILQSDLARITDRLDRQQAEADQQEQSREAERQRAHEADLQKQQQAHDATQADADRAHEAGIQGQDQAHEAAIQGADQSHAADLQSSDQEHQVGMQDAAQEAALQQAKAAPKPKAKG